MDKEVSVAPSSILIDWEFLNNNFENAIIKQGANRAGKRL